MHRASIHLKHVCAVHITLWVYLAIPGDSKYSITKYSKSKNFIFFNKYKWYNFLAVYLQQILVIRPVLSTPFFVNNIKFANDFLWNIYWDSHYSFPLCFVIYLIVPRNFVFSIKKKPPFLSKISGFLHISWFR